MSAPHPTDGDAGLVERLRFDSARCEATYSRGVASNIEEAAARIASLSAEVERLTRERDAAFRAVDNIAATPGMALSDIVLKFQESDRRALAAEARLASMEAEVRAACVAAVPTNWCDPLLTGPDVPRGPLDNRGVEKLLLGIIERIRAAAIRSGG